MDTAASNNPTMVQIARRIAGELAHNPLRPRSEAGGVEYFA